MAGTSVQIECLLFSITNRLCGPSTSTQELSESASQDAAPDIARPPELGADANYRLSTPGIASAFDNKNALLHKIGM